MTIFNVGAKRPATDDARLSAANDLVKRTLARHGLLSGSNTARPTTLPVMDGLLAQMPRANVQGPVKPSIPDGTRFEQNTYTCASGSRMYRTYVPKTADSGVTGIVMMLHGCTQNPEDFAAGTRMNALAEKHGFVVIYPAQSRGDNAQSCWNWFSRRDQRRGRGEPAILAGLASQIATEYDIGRDRTFVAGLSAGGAMAVILGEAYPEVFAAIGAHSGLPVGAAKDVASAFAAMGGTILDAQPVPRGGPKVRTIVFHGTVDSTVHPENGTRIARRAAEGGAQQSIETTDNGANNGRSYSRSITCDATGECRVEHWEIHGLGHAWSGGSASGSYTDPTGPDASAEMVRFFFDIATGAS